MAFTVHYETTVHSTSTVLATVLSSSSTVRLCPWVLEGMRIYWEISSKIIMMLK